MTAKPPQDKDGHEVCGPNDDRPKPRTVEAFEARRASPVAKVAGKHIQTVGLISKRGYQRVLPNYEDEEWLEWEKPERLAELEEIKGKVLHQRNATIFE